MRDGGHSFPGSLTRSALLVHGLHRCLRANGVEESPKTGRYGTPAFGAFASRNGALVELGALNQLSCNLDAYLTTSSELESPR